MFHWAWNDVLRAHMLRGVPARYKFALFSHRVLRYASGVLHVVLLAATIALVVARSGMLYDLALAGQLAWLALAAVGRLRLRVPGAGIAYYYFLVTWATVAALAGYLRTGVSPHWERAEGMR
jgi:hypothetical protein